MPRRPALALVASILILAAAGLLQGHTRDSQPLLDAPAAADEVLVRLSPAGLSLSDETLGRRLKGTVTGRLPELAVVRLRLREHETVSEALQRLIREPFVEMAEPNHLLHTTVVPTDPFYSAQSSYLGLIGAPQAWEITTGMDSVIVAVLDSGIDLEHPDLKSRIWLNQFETADNKIDDDDNGCVDDLHGCNFVSAGSADASCASQPAGSITDDNGHGTFVAGIIAAQANNGIGLSGVAPGVKVLAVKILDCLGGGTAADAARALLYAARVGARVANISFGADGESQTLAAAIREAHDGYGMLIVAATGNEGTGRVTFPARLPQTMAVASSGTAFDVDARSPYSDWGPEVSVAAPGLNIVSTVPAPFCETTWLCVQDQPYAISSGTSFAAPIVSGVAALLVSRNPFLSPEALRELIEATAEPLADGSTPHWAGAGRISMAEALGVKRYYLGAAGVARQQ